MPAPETPPPTVPPAPTFARAETATSPRRFSAEGLQQTNEELIGPWQLVLLPCSLLALISAAIQMLHRMPPEQQRLLNFFDMLVCGVFAIDFVARWRVSQNRRTFLRRNWPDLIACVPAGLFVLARLVWVVRVLALFRVFRSMEVVTALFLHCRTRAGMAALALTLFLLVGLASSMVLGLEDVPEANIKTASDALWWAMSTVTTVGYGDRFPVTTAGRALGMVLMVCGVGVYGTFAAMLAAWFVRPEEDAMRLLLAEVQATRREVEELRLQMTAGVTTAGVTTAGVRELASASDTAATGAPLARNVSTTPR